MGLTDLIKNEKIKENISLGVFGLYFAACGVGIGVMGFTFHNFIVKPEQMRNEFRQAYRSALVQYADVNLDGFVSQTEKDSFDTKLIKDKGVTLVVGEMPKYENGNEVPIEVITTWLKEYHPPQ